MIQHLVIIGLFVASILLVVTFSYLFNRVAASATSSDPLLDVGGFKFSVHEALMGALTTVIFVLCAAFYARFIAEANQMRTAQILGAWQFGYSPDTGNDDKIIAWLMSGHYDPYDIGSDYRTEFAVSLADHHVVTRRALLATDAVVRHSIWVVAGLAVVQSLLNSRNLHGLRILMPAMIVTIVSVLFLFFPEMRELVHMLNNIQH